MQLFELLDQQYKSNQGNADFSTTLQRLHQASPIAGMLEGVSIWRFDADAEQFNCIGDCNPSSPNIGRHIAISDIPAQLLDAALMQRTTFWASELSAEEKAFVMRHWRVEPTLDYALTPVAPLGTVEGYFVLRSNTPFSEWDKPNSEALFVYIQHLKEVFLNYIYQRSVDEVREKKRLLDEIEQIAHIGGWRLDCKTQNLLWTREAYEIFELNQDTHVDLHSLYTACEKSDKIKLEQLFMQLKAFGRPFQLEHAIESANGNKKWIRTSGKAFYHNGDVKAIYGAFEDITKEKYLLDQQTENTNYLATILNSLNDAIIAIDEHGIVESANTTVESVFGYTEAELVGQSISCLMPQRYADAHARYMENYLTTGQAKIIGVGRELPAVRKNGEQFPMELTLSEVLSKGKRLFIGIVKDISERKRDQDKIYRLAYFEPLTNLPNRRYLEEMLSNLIDRVHMSGGYLLVSKLNIDRFSRINLSHGRIAGDHALTMLTERIKLALPKTILLFHAGGDTFYFCSNQPTFVSDSAITKQATDIVNDVMRQISERLILDGHSYSLTASVATCFIQQSNSNFEHLQELLTMALNQARSHGGGQHILVDENTNATLERRAKIKSLLSNAIDAEELALVLQPQYDAQGNYYASEALLRWHSEELGTISPLEFIQIAEESRDIIDIGNWVLHRVCQLLSKCPNCGKIAVNLSAKQFIQPDFEKSLLDILEQYKVSTNRIVMELTETTLVEDLESIQHKMVALEGIGIEFAIDDFGTGYSSLSYLRSLPIDEIKIDKVFVDEITPSNQTVPIVDSIIQLAKGLRVRVVAEGVEDDYQVEYLRAKECDYFQGYFFAKPMSIEDWVAHVQRHSNN